MMNVGSIFDILIHFLLLIHFSDNMFLPNSNVDDVSDARGMPLYEKLSRDRRIEGRVCRGEDRVEVSF